MLLKDRDWLFYSVCGKSIIRINIVANLDGVDVTWHSVHVWVWTILEDSVGIMSACLPTCVSLISLFFFFTKHEITRLISHPKAHSLQMSVRACRMQNRPTRNAASPAPSTRRGPHLSVSRTSLQWNYLLSKTKKKDTKMLERAMTWIKILETIVLTPHSLTTSKQASKRIILYPPSYLVRRSYRMCPCKRQARRWDGKREKYKVVGLAIKERCLRECSRSGVYLFLSMASQELS